MDVARQLLGQSGYAVTAPERVPETKLARPQIHIDPIPILDPDDEESDSPRSLKPLMEGMIPVTSSNVPSIGYE